MSNHGEFRIVETEDQSLTIFSAEYDQAMHTMSGALEESRVKYIFASGLTTRQPKEKIAVLDVGFGLGYNVYALYLHCREAGLSCDVVSLERDNSYVAELERVATIMGNSDYALIAGMFQGQELSEHGFSAGIAWGDARKSIRMLRENGYRTDYVFQDAYSPGKNPELWTKDWFCELSALMHPDAVLVTYSAAPQVRGALLAAGFHIGRTPSTGPKKEGTIAMLRPFENELGAEDLIVLQNDYHSVAYRDPELSDSRQVILERRIEEMRLRRELQRRS